MEVHRTIDYSGGDRTQGSQGDPDLAGTGTPEDGESAGGDRPLSPEEADSGSLSGASVSGTVFGGWVRRTGSCMARRL